VSVARHICRETRRAKKTGAAFHFSDFIQIIGQLREVTPDLQISMNNDVI
jgi:hypothetical protein